MKQIAAKIQSSIRRRGIAGFLLQVIVDALEFLARRLVKIRDHYDAASYKGTKRNCETLVVVLAGYKPKLWPLTLRRIAEHLPNDVAVCVVTAGKNVDDLAKFCQNQNWLYISTRQNKTGLALNKAIAAYPSARWVFKIDEDIFVSHGFFEDMRAGYEKILAEGRHHPGFCSPTLNVNGVSYTTFLEQVGASSEYFDAFNELRVACSGNHAHYDPAAAIWLWEHSLPLDDVAKQFRCQEVAETSRQPRMIGTRFSIGAILLERDFLDEIGGFRSSWIPGVLGVDESALCAACVERSRPMFFLTNVLAGHFSFYTQERAMLDALPRLEKADPATFG